LTSNNGTKIDIGRRNENSSLSITDKPLTGTIYTTN